MDSIGQIAVSIVVPCHNEADNLIVLHERLSQACRAAADDYEIVYVSDGSKDETWAGIYTLMRNDPHVVGVNLSRNFGHQIAVTAGLEQVRDGNHVLIIDADLQDPPELLKPMLATMMAEQADVVYGQRVKRNGETKFKLYTAAAFYRLFRSVTDINLPADTGDFRLISPRVVDALRQMPEQQRFLRGMVAWIGFRQIAFPYERRERFAGVTSYPLKKMVRFSVDAFTSFSIAPLRFATITALIAAALSVLIAAYIGVALVSGNAVPGWASVMGVVVVFSTVQLLVLGILGEYVGRLMMESKRRPLYLLESVVRQGSVAPMPRKEAR